MGILQIFKDLFSGNNKTIQSKKVITIDIYSPIEKLISKKEQKNLTDLIVLGPARSGKGAEMFRFIKSISEKYDNLTNVDLSGVVGLEEVPEEALFKCKSIKKVVLPAGVICIKNRAFKSCSNLESVFLPEGLERILEEAFSNCPHLALVVLPKSLYRIGKEVFSGDDLIEEISIPSRVESIGTGALNCKGLKRITVEPHNPSYISTDNVLFSRNGSALVKYANNNEASEYTIPNGVAKIVEEAFYGCKCLTRVNFSGNVNIISDKAFMDCEKIEKLEIPSSVERIGQEAFKNCTSLQSVKLQNGIASIGDRAFAGCTKLFEINIPNSLSKMGNEAFAGCASLKSFALPSSVEYVGKNIFEGTITSK